MVFAALAVVVLVVGALAYGLGDPGSTLLGPAVVRGPLGPGGREVTLTFDDGPAEPYTSQILDILRAHDVKATFFVCGSAAERHPALVRRIAAEGHEIGNHTYSHPSLHLRSRAAIAAEVDAAQDALERILGRRPTLFRPPFGVRWFPLWSVLKERGLVMMLWTDRGYDGRLDAPGIAAATLKRLRPGSIILLHDGDEAALKSDRSATVGALPAIIAGARAKGLTFAAPAPPGRLLAASRDIR